MGRFAAFLLLLLVVGESLSAAVGVAVPMLKRGNVRFGPSTEAPVVTTLSPGTTVQVLRPAEGQEGWYEIQFPRQGHAWMHQKVLQPTDDPRRLRVIVDQANVRSDARIRGELVAQLDRGERVEWIGSEAGGEWQGRKVGDWYAIYPPGAVAYTHEIVLDLTKELQARLNGQAVANNEVDRRWQAIKRVYEQYRQVLERDQQAGLAQDWPTLAAELQRVIDEHPTVRVRLQAKRLQSGIRRVIAVAKRSGITIQQQPLELLPQDTGAGAIAQAPDPAPAKRQPPAKQPEPAVQPVPEPAPAPEPVASTTPASDPVVEDTAEPAAAEVAPPAIALEPEPAGVSEGWLFQRDIEGVDANHVLVGADSQVAALITVAPGAAVSLGEFFWRRVGVRGQQRQVTATVDGQERTLPLITVTDIHLVRR